MEDIEEVIDEVRLVWHVVVRAGERLHAKEPITLGMRAVLEHLVRHGAATVPQIARARRVTRQHIQGLVNALLEEKLVSVEDNPAHRRSVLVRLTPGGDRTIARMRRRERSLLERTTLGVTAVDLRRVAAVLRAVRTKLEARR